MRKYTCVVVAAVPLVVAPLVSPIVVHAQAPPPAVVSDTVMITFAPPIPLVPGSDFRFEDGVVRSSADHKYRGKVTCRITSDQESGEACVKELTKGKGTPLNVPGFGLMVFGTMRIGEPAHDQRAGQKEEISFSYTILLGGLMVGAGHESDDEVLAKPGQATAGVVGQAVLTAQGDGLAGVNFRVFEPAHS